jgi:hypothetical protein
MARKRFNPEERAILAGGAGAQVQVQNVTQWHDAVLVSGEIIREADGWQWADAVIRATRGHLRAGDKWPVTPGHLRRPAITTGTMPPGTSPRP